MDLDIDMDFSTICDDKIQTFLKEKLEEIRLQNEALQNVLHERKMALIQNKPTSDENFTIENVWKKVFNGKYAIGFELMHPKRFENVSVALSYSFESPLSYNVHTFRLGPQKTPCTPNNNFDCIICDLIKKSDVFEQKAYVIISFNIPQFTQNLNYYLSGFVTCSGNGTVISSSIPKIELSTKDSICQTSWTMDKNSLSSLLTMVCCSSMTQLVIVLPEEWTTPLVSTFEIHCLLTHVSIEDKNYFIANKISQSFDNTLVTIHSYELKDGFKNDIFINVYTLGEKELLNFVHHLHSSLPNSIIVPVRFYKSVVLNRQSIELGKSNRDVLNDFGKNLRADIEQSYYFAKMACWKNQSVDSKMHKFTQQREKLSRQESETDFQYLQVFKI